MKKSTFKIFKVIIITPIVIAICMYLLFAWYYKDTFSYGTWINGVYCTGKNIDEINEELLMNAQVDSFEILLPEGISQVLVLEQIDYQIVFMDELEKRQKNQNPLLWGENIFNKDGILIQPKCTYSEELLKNEMENFMFYKKAMSIDKYKISIDKTEDGYVYTDTRKSILDTKMVLEKVSTSLKSGKSYVNLYDNSYYYEIPITPNDLETIALWEKIEEAQDFSTVFLFGKEEEIIDVKIVSNWISVNENGQFILDESGNLLIDETKIEEYVQSLAEKYNTYDYPREYRTIDGKMVSINRGNYGNSFDVETECEYLKNAYKNKLEERHVPTYTKMALYQGQEDIGMDYIEIDLTNQKMYCVYNGILEIETDVVTGNVSAGMKTKDRVCYIYTKQTNRILRGDGYASQVDFWMPIYGGIGIHDAKWRNKFGGDIYKNYGSHGCINTPRDVMEEIFEKSYVGMPVIMYY